MKLWNFGIGRLLYLKLMIRSSKHISQNILGNYKNALTHDWNDLVDNNLKLHGIRASNMHCIQSRCTNLIQRHLHNIFFMSSKFINEFFCNNISLFAVLTRHDNGNTVCAMNMKGDSLLCSHICGTNTKNIWYFNFYF